jgi:hypothetical protein
VGREQGEGGATKRVFVGCGVWCKRRREEQNREGEIGKVKKG